VTDPVRLTLADAEDLCVRALVASNTSEANACSTARALLSAEADGQRGHGLTRVPSYAAQAKSGKVDGHAKPMLEQLTPALVRVDARSGFAYPAIDLACNTLPALTRECGVAAAGIHRSHHLGQAGAHAERLALDGLVALVFSNSPKAVAFWGSREPAMGTNPIAFAAPRKEQEPLVIDMSLSKVARGKVLAAKHAGERIPDSWALDMDGRPTTDPDRALQGSMLAIGDAKGAALVLIVEILSAALTGSRFGYEASSFFDGVGEPPGVGHLFITFEPALISGGAFDARLSDILGRIDSTDGARTPGTSRLQHRAAVAKTGLEISHALFANINRIIQSGGDHG
jgi:(2R)-3-sulfolactate dehydrogenase (NADP+)